MIYCELLLLLITFAGLMCLHHVCRCSRTIRDATIYNGAGGVSWKLYCSNSGLLIMTSYQFVLKTFFGVYNDILMFVLLIGFKKGIIEFA